MDLNIYISDYAKTKVLQLPIIPAEMPSISHKSSNEDFETWWDGTYNFIEKQGLITLSLDSWLPASASKYNFCKSQVNASEIIELIKSAMDKAEAIRVVVTGDTTYNLNDSFSVESFEYSIMKRGDYKYSLSLKQWREYSTTVTGTTAGASASQVKLGWNQDSTGWWYVTDVASNTYYKGCWQLIDNVYYSFKPDGYMLTGWLEDGGCWYYLKDSGAMAKNEWVTVDGKSYYLGDNGAMYVSTTTPDGYQVGSDGAWVQ